MSTTKIRKYSLLALAAAYAELAAARLGRRRMPDWSRPPGESRQRQLRRGCRRSTVGPAQQASGCAWCGRQRTSVGTPGVAGAPGWVRHARRVGTPPSGRAVRVRRH
jgi:hypothetical protein